MMIKIGNKSKFKKIWKDKNKKLLNKFKFLVEARGFKISNKINNQIELIQKLQEKIKRFRKKLKVLK